MSSPPAEDAAVAAAADNATLESYFDPSWFAMMARFEEGHYWYLHRRDVVLDCLAGRLAGTPRLLDVGCGAGGIATHLNEHGLAVDYADGHDGALDAARARAEARLGAAVAARSFVKLDVTRDALPPGYDGVLLLDVLEHLPDDLGVARRLRAALPEGGLLLVTVPAYRYLWSPWDDLSRHKRRYTPATIRRLLEASGFRVERLTHVFCPLWFAALAVKGLRTVVGAVRKPVPRPPTELVEARYSPRTSAAMMRLLGLERRWLRRRDLSPGTTLLGLARAAS